MMKGSFIIYLWLFLFSAFRLEGQVVASFTVDTNGVKSFAVLLTAQDTVPGYRYFWDLGDATSDAGSVVEHLYPGAGHYRVVLTVTDPVTSLSDTAGRVITIRDVLEIPNVFTPNNDNINDLFIVRSNGADVFALTVFTRAGVKVCETRGQTIVWDGRTPAGNLVTPGVYYYILKSDKGISKTGFVHVIR